MASLISNEDKRIPPPFVLPDLSNMKFESLDLRDKKVEKEFLEALKKYGIPVTSSINADK